MAIIRWNPWNIDRFFDDDWDFPTIPGLTRLAGQGLNLYETEDSIVAEAALPGISEDNIDITIEDRVVRIVGSQEEKKTEKNKKRSFMSTLASSYNYSFRLPEGVIAEKEPECVLQDGVLRLTFPKVKKAPPKRIAVKKVAKESKPEVKVKTEGK